VRATIVIGTPFYGSVKAAYILNSGRGTPVPLPRRRLRALGRTLPGLHDLLPTYRCVDEGATARHLNLSDITALGGDLELAAESRRVHQALRKVDSKGMRALVGVDQPTMQSLILRDGVMQEQYYTCERYGDGALRRLDRRGDSTVYRDSASGGCIEPAYLPQSHGAVANTEEAASFVCSILTERPLGPPMGVASLGLDVPDVVVAGESLQVTALGVDSPNDVRGFLVDVESNQRIGPLLFGWRSDMVTAQAVLPTNGIYRVEVKAGASSAVTQMVMAIAPEHSTESESPL
jgi:hypothetical protein